MFSSPTTLIAKIYLNGSVRYFHHLDAHVHDEGVMAVYDVSGRLSSEINKLSNFECYVSTPKGIVSLIDDYIVVIKSNTNFYSSEYIDSLPKVEVDYDKMLDELKRYGEELDVLCDTSDEKLESFSLRLVRKNT